MGEGVEVGALGCGLARGTACRPEARITLSKVKRASGLFERLPASLRRRRGSRGAWLRISAGYCAEHIEFMDGPKRSLGFTEL